MSRKIIQITTYDNPNSTIVLTALCDDGTVWKYYGKLVGNLYKKVWEFVTDGPE